MRPVTGCSSLALHIAAHPVAGCSRSSRSHVPSWAFLSRLHVAMRPVAGRFSLTLHVATRPVAFFSHSSCSRVYGWTFSCCVSQPFKRTHVFYVKKRKRCENAIKTNTKRKRSHRCMETEWKRNVNFILAAIVAVRCFTSVVECSSPNSTDFFVADSLEACCLDSRGFYARANGPNDTDCDQCIGKPQHLRVRR